jgi:O-methyltransferase involved in polyketide biosynthesis
LYMSLSDFSEAHEFPEQRNNTDIPPPTLSEVPIGTETDEDEAIDAADADDPFGYDDSNIGIDDTLVAHEPETDMPAEDWEADDTALHAGAAAIDSAVATPDDGHTEIASDTEAPAPSHAKIAVTAINNTKLMALSDIALYPEIAEIASEHWAAGDHDAQPTLIEPRINAPGIEVRYRLASNLTNNAEQVLDIGAGLTPRGLTTTAANPGKTYVELDLPVTIEMKSSIIQTLEERGLAHKPDNLHLEAGNGLDADAVHRAASHFDPGKPVAVTTEGVLHYLPNEEKAILAGNIRAVLQTHSGVWYTDMPIQQGISERDSQMADTTTQQTGRSIAANRFTDESAAREFFAAQGLEVKRLHSYIEPGLIDSLTSPAAVGATHDEIIEANRPWSLWEIGLPDDELRQGQATA